MTRFKYCFFCSYDMNKLLEECVDYDFDEDIQESGGAYGGVLAERVYQRYGRFDTKKIIEEQAQLDVWKKIAFRKFPPLLPGETILVREIKARLSELKKAGYDVKSGYSKLRKKDTWDYFREIKRDISSHFR